MTPEDLKELRKEAANAYAAIVGGRSVPFDVATIASGCLALADDYEKIVADYDRLAADLADLRSQAGEGSHADLVARARAAEEERDSLVADCDQLGIACQRLGDTARENLAALQEALAERDKLAAVVVKLPKDGDGNPLMPYTTYWFCVHGELRSGVYTVVEHGLHTPSRCWAPTAPKSYFKSPEAAAKAKGETR